MYCDKLSNKTSIIRLQRQTARRIIITYLGTAELERVAKGVVSLLRGTTLDHPKLLRDTLLIQAHLTDRQVEPAVL